MRTLLTRLAAATTLAALPLGAGAAAHADSHDGEAMVSVVHGVPGATVDVYANGEALLTGFEPGTVTDPVALPAGSYDLKVTEAGAGADGAALIEAQDVAVPGGANATVVAHLDADGAPVLTPFVNDVSQVAPGEARLTVRHTAAAPAVDVRANGEVAFGDLANPDEASADLPAGTITADVVLAGTEDVAIGPADLDLTEGSNTVVYAYGSAADGNLALAVQQLDGMHSAPGGVAGGTGGQAADMVAPVWLVGFGGLVAGGAVLLLTRPRAARVRG